MKFAKELEEELVPEWRAKYLDYKACDAGKKKLKAITRAIQKANKSPRHPSLRQDHGIISTQDPIGFSQNEADKKLEANDLTHQAPSTPGRTSSRPSSGPRSTPIQRSERQPLRTPGSRFSGNAGTYGSIIPSPQGQHDAESEVATLELPDPALDPEEGYSHPERTDVNPVREGPQSPSPVLSPRSTVPDRNVNRPAHESKPSLASRGSFHSSKRGHTSSGPSTKRTSHLLKRVFSYTGEPPEKRGLGESSSEIERRQDEFFVFLDNELSKIESFYKTKEEEATQRLRTLRQQLHIMRDQRTQQVLGAQKILRKNNTDSQQASGFGPFNPFGLKDAFIGRNRFGKNSEALAQMAPPNTAGTQGRDEEATVSRRDFARRPDDTQYTEVSYRTAKKKLKHALQEFYRGVELLKAYAYLNRTAFRKINKKYDKVVNARPTMRYMSDKVNQAWFVNSELADNLMASAEDLYSRYFERGNRKLAVSKLRRTSKKAGDHSPNWRQLLEFPSAFFFLLGLFMWLNFYLSVNDMYIYWPVILIGLTVIVLFLPARVLYHRSRQWWAYSNWRLVLAGLYPVEFRDFFLGDMYCSQTYAMGNIELFFCLYARSWNDPPQCNSSHSRLLGFFMCLPAIWRAFQCLRRYADTKNVFPHLANFGKYIFSVLYYMTLSMYRIERMTRFQAPFITFALLNAVYVSVWDLAMDWSLGNPYAKHPLLRDVLAFRRAWVYYVAMVIDVIIRFNWIFYAIFAHDIQHSQVLSFAVSFSEICRRGVWTVFRVENEHCTNVLLFRASRDVPLPYEVPKPGTESGHPSVDLPPQDQQGLTPFLGPTDIEHGAQTPPTPGTVARARGQISRVGTIVATAHAQDFQRKKRPDQIPGAAVQHDTERSPDETSEEEEEADSGDSRHDTDDDSTAAAIRRRTSHVRISEESDHPYE
ncbi:Xenotropic and polytropic retrovirus receptor 1 [Aspergillus wentii]|nr:Xenotropic and polytropic retrovirus receptor 1 [Aspergillus wentii]